MFNSHIPDLTELSFPSDSCNQCIHIEYRPPSGVPEKSWDESFMWRAAEEQQRIVPAAQI